MKRIIAFTATLTLFFLIGCASKEVKKEEPRTFKKPYEVINASSGYYPKWIEDPQTQNGESKNNQRRYKYFVSETDNVKNKRLCIKSANTRASAQIAAQITQVIKNDYGEATQGSPDEEAESYMSETLSNEAMAFVAGVSTVKTYWEQRRYKVELGAEDDETSYSCYALVKISRKTLKKAVDNAVKKFVLGVRDTETKQMVKEALKDTSKKMDAMTKPVKIEKDEE